MAGLAPDFTLPSNSFFNIYSDGPVAAGSPVLPGGPCNFVDLAQGANGPKCGCRRFWSRGASSERTSPTGFPPGYGPASGTTTPEGQGAFCMCSHHACFHDDVGSAPSTATAALMPPPMTNPHGQENEKPKINREPLTPVLPGLSFFPAAPHGDNGYATDPTTFNNASFSANAQQDAPPDVSQTEAMPAREPSIPDTMNWGDFIQSQPDQGAILPPIPSQCLIPSQPSSTTSSTRLAYLRPFSGKGLQTLSGVKAGSSNLRSDPLQAKTDEETPVLPRLLTVPREYDAADQPSDQQTVLNTPRSASRQTQGSNQRPSEPANAVDVTDEGNGTGPRGVFQELSSAIQGHDQRLDRLENVSFTAAGHDDCVDKHDQADLRVTELEYRVGEVEKMLNDSGGAAARSASSIASESTTGSVVDRAELYSQLQSLKSQLSQIQGLSSFITPSRPWEIEVVFLPFPMRGIWLPAQDHTSQRLSGGNHIDADPWMQLPSSVSSFFDDHHHQTRQQYGYPRSSSPFPSPSGDWTGPESESDWLLPRACAPDRMIDQRLRSRGLVKRVSIPGPDARSVQRAVTDAFGQQLFHTFSRMQANVHHGSTAQRRARGGRYLALQQPWIPLRKIHRDSRLRFLEPSEMLTPANWDVQFLRTGGVAMRGAGGSYRLFITHAEAYLQDQEAYDNGWSWQRLRELSRVYPDSQAGKEHDQQTRQVQQDGADVPEADALEEYWQWNEKLDELSANTSRASSVSAPSVGLRQVDPMTAAGMAQPQQHLRRSTSIPPSQYQHRSVFSNSSPYPANTSTRTAVPLGPLSAPLRRATTAFAKSRGSSPRVSVGSKIEKRDRRSKTVVSNANAASRIPDSISPASARRRPPHIRTTSMPPMARGLTPSPAVGSAEGDGRRSVATPASVQPFPLVSAQQQQLVLHERRRSSPVKQQQQQQVLLRQHTGGSGNVVASTSNTKQQRRQQQRRSSRGTRSPSAAAVLRGLPTPLMTARRGITPRWSTASPDPLQQAQPNFFTAPGGAAAAAHPYNGGNNNNGGTRATTPFYYATPYSNAPAFIPSDGRSASRGPSVSVAGGAGGGMLMLDDYYDDEDDDQDTEYNSAHGSDEDDEEFDSQMLDMPLDHYDKEVEGMGADLMKSSFEESFEEDDPGEDDRWWDQGKQATTLPEDEPWPGIEDAENHDPLSSRRLPTVDNDGDLDISFEEDEEADNGFSFLGAPAFNQEKSDTERPVQVGSGAVGVKENTNKINIHIDPDAAMSDIGSGEETESYDEDDYDTPVSSGSRIVKHEAESQSQRLAEHIERQNTNNDVADDDDGDERTNPRSSSRASSVPSEYPSTQSAWLGESLNPRRQGDDLGGEDDEDDFEVFED